MSVLNSAPKGSSALIQQLLKAEQQAEAIVSKAREDAVKKRREARVSAEEESTLYRKKEEERFQREFEERFGQSDNGAAELEKRTAEELARVKKDYDDNKDRVIEFNKKCTTTIDLHVSSRRAKLIAQMDTLRA
eukprot:GHVQ01025329.1.p1 GENE.GHVQ01025329.1~~GHVQ01025329.1.p1  ORF type:complete len:134 (+),score=25.74 GHVQ01025329.1:576-977(+)